jgi:hypothetical protein
LKKVISYTILETTGGIVCRNIKKHCKNIRQNRLNILKTVEIKSRVTGVTGKTKWFIKKGSRIENRSVQ